MSILDWFKIAGVMLGVLWWGWILLKLHAREGKPISFIGYLGAAMALPMFIGVAVLVVMGLLLPGVCWLGLIPASQTIAICY